MKLERRREASESKGFEIRYTKEKKIYKLQLHWGCVDRCNSYENWSSIDTIKRFLPIPCLYNKEGQGD